MVQESARSRAALVKRLAGETGFNLVGIAPAEPSRWGEAYRAWIAAGEHGAMEYLGRHLDERLDIQKRFPWARSVVAVALAYWQPDPPTEQRPDAASPAGRIARYAWGRDYHRVIGHKLEQFEKQLRAALAPEAFEARIYTDTGPVLEREWAVRAGLGWMGKHTLVIHPRHGSWFLLGEMITSLELAADHAMPDHCGTCTRCIDACPTKAITPYHVDATKCLSYQTLENRGEVPESLHPPMAAAGFIAGCDICQEACPHNRQPLASTTADFTLRDPAPAMSLQEILAWSEQEWDIATRGRAHRRARYDMWQRNARILLEGQAETPAPPAAT